MTKREYKYHQWKKYRKNRGKLVMSDLLAAYDILKGKRDSIVTKDLFVGKSTIEMLNDKLPKAQSISFCGYGIPIVESNLFPFQMADGSWCHGVMIPQPEIDKIHSWADEIMEQERKRFVDDLFLYNAGRTF